MLVTAASHTAVDNLAERLVRAGVRLVRIGHPARVSEEMESHTLDALLEAAESSKLAEGWVREAEQLRQRLAQRMKRGAVSREERFATKSEINGLFASARRATKDAQKNILHGATVIAATAAGADAWQLDGLVFDRVVLDQKRRRRRTPSRSSRSCARQEGRDGGRSVSAPAHGHRQRSGRTKGCPPRCSSGSRRESTAPSSSRCCAYNTVCTRR